MLSAIELGSLSNECTISEQQFMQWGAVLAGLMDEKSLLAEGYIMTLHESDDVKAEHSCTFSVTVAFNLDYFGVTQGVITAEGAVAAILKINNKAALLELLVASDGMICVQCKCGASVAHDLHVQTALAAGSLVHLHGYLG